MPFTEEYSEKVRDYFNNLYTYPWEKVQETKLPRRYRPYEPEYIQDIIDDAFIQEGDRVLNIGCGSVELDVHIAQRLKNITIESLDISDVIMEKNLSLLDSVHGGNKIKLKRGDFNKLSEYYEEGYFDKIIAIDSISFAEDLTHVIKEIRKVLKPTGFVYIRDIFSPIYPRNTILFEMCQGYADIAKQVSFCDYMELHKFTESFCRNKFLIDEVKNLTDDTYYTGDAYFINFVEYASREIDNPEFIKVIEERIGMKIPTVDVDPFTAEFGATPIGNVRTYRGNKLPIIDYLGFRLAGYEIDMPLPDINALDLSEKSPEELSMLTGIDYVSKIKSTIPTTGN